MENKAGALSRVVGLFSARGFNIENLNVAPTQDETVSRLTLVTYCDEKLIEQINKQLNKLIEVIKLVNLSDAAHQNQCRCQTARPLLTIGRSLPRARHCHYPDDGHF